MAAAATLTAPVAAAAGCAGADSAPSSSNLETVSAATLCLINARRAEAGLPGLVGEGRLAEAALRHSRDMVERSYFSHDAPDGSSVADRVRATGYLDGARGWTVGENLAWGTGSFATPNSIVQGWMESPGHRANMLSDGFREIGLGLVLGNPRQADGRGATYTTVFGAVAGRPVAQPGSGSGGSGDGSPQPGADPDGSTGTGAGSSGGDRPADDASDDRRSTRMARKHRRCARHAKRARRARSSQARVKYRRAANRCRARAAARAR